MTIKEADVRRVLEHQDGVEKWQHNITLAVFNAIAWYGLKNDGVVPNRVLQNFAHIGKNQVSCQIKRLEEAGAITVDRQPNMYNRYTLGTTETLERAMTRVDDATP